MDKEKFKLFLGNLLETKFSREKLLEGLIEDEEQTTTEGVVEAKDGDEVCPALDEGEYEHYIDLNDLSDEEYYQLLQELDAAGIPYEIVNATEEKEEDEEKLVELVNYDAPSVKLTEEEIEYIEEIADKIEPIHLGRVFPCVVNGEDKYLKDGENCNFVDIPILGLTLVSPVNLTIDVLYINPNSESLEEITVLAVVHNDVSSTGFGCETTIGDLRKRGLLELFATYDLELDLTPLAFRGLTTKVDENELEDLID